VVQSLKSPEGQIYILGIELNPVRNLAQKNNKDGISNGLNKDIKIAIGGLGNISFRRGFYLYIGSAKNRLGSRLRRHLSTDKRLFWHIDYLLTSNAACIKKVWVNSNKRECSVAQLINQNLNSRIIKGFGSSDCRCPGHLIFIPYPKRDMEFMDKDISLAKFFKEHGFKKIKLHYKG